MIFLPQSKDIEVKLIGGFEFAVTQEQYVSEYAIHFWKQLCIMDSFMDRRSLALAVIKQYVQYFLYLFFPVINEMWVHNYSRAKKGYDLVVSKTDSSGEAKCQTFHSNKARSFRWK